MLKLHKFVHNYATSIHNVYKTEKSPVCLRHEIITGVSAWINLRLGLHIAEVFKTCMDVLLHFLKLSLEYTST